MNILRIIYLAAWVVVIAACTDGNSEKPSKELLQLGKTSENQIVAVMGDPDTSKSGELRGETIKALVYKHEFEGIDGAVSRSAVFFVLDGVLVGHYFISSFPHEFTDFNVARVGHIVEGESTRLDVEAILGKPAGEAIYPFIESRDGRLLWYKSETPKIAKSADIELDQEGIVRYFSVTLGPDSHGKHNIPSGETMSLVAIHYDVAWTLAHKLSLHVGAEDGFRDVLRLAPRFAEAHYNLAITLAHQSKWDEALLEFKRALAILPTLELAIAGRDLAQHVVTHGAQPPNTVIPRYCRVFHELYELGC